MKQPSQVVNQPAIHRFFESVNNNIDINEEGCDRANRRVNAEEIENETLDEKMISLPYNEELDAVGNEGSDSSDIEVLPSKKKRVIDSAVMSQMMIVLLFSMKVLLVRMEIETDKGSMACGSDNNHKAEKIVLILRKK